LPGVIPGSAAVRKLLTAVGDEGRQLEDLLVVERAAVRLPPGRHRGAGATAGDGLLDEVELLLGLVGVRLPGVRELRAVELWRHAGWIAARHHRAFAVDAVAGIAQRREALDAALDRGVFLTLLGVRLANRIEES